MTTKKAAKGLGTKMSKHQRDARLWALKIDLFRETIKAHHVVEAAKPVEAREAFDVKDWTDAIAVMAETQLNVEEMDNGSD